MGNSPGEQSASLFLTPVCVPPAVMGCRPDKLYGGTLSVITTVTFFVVLHVLGVEDATIGLAF